MIKALKVMMIIWAVAGILFGLQFILAPGLLYSTFGFQNVPAYVSYFLALLGIAYIIPGIFVIIASRNPLMNIMWIQLAIVWSLLDALMAIYFMIRGVMNFRQVGIVPIIFDGIFAIVFLVLYPWRKASTV